MPFKSEAQRRYLWANEPEIARDWTDTYGSRIHKNGGGIMSMQGGVQNHLGQQKEVTAPLKWQSSPDHPTTELAYITQAEKDLLVKQDLHNSLKGGVNRGPAGIMSLNGWGSEDPGQNVSGAAASAAETGSRNAADRAEVQAQFAGSGPALPPGVTPQGALDFRAAAINAGAGQRVNPGFFDSRTHLNPNEIAAAKAYRNDPNNRFAKQAYRNTGQSGIGNFISGGGFFGNLVRGLGQKFGLGKKYNEPTYDMSGSNKLGLYNPSVNPEHYNDLGNEFALSTEADEINFDDYNFPGMEKVEIINEDGDTYEEAISKGTFDGDKHQFDAVWGEQGDPG